MINDLINCLRSRRQGSVPHQRLKDFIEMNKTFSVTISIGKRKSVSRIHELTSKRRKQSTNSFLYDCCYLNEVISKSWKIAVVTDGTAVDTASWS